MTLVYAVYTYPKFCARFGDFKYGDRIGWFRILGWGLHIKDTRKHELLFSERHGLVRSVQIGPYRVRLLTGWKR